MRRLVVNSDDDDNADKNVQEVELDELLPDPPATFLTIVWSDRGDVVLNIGSVGYWQARGILEAVISEFRDWAPPVDIEGDAVEAEAHWYDDDDDEEEEEEEEDDE